jgi:DNA-binding LacI/PurR family transcriptional regulator
MLAAERVRGIIIAPSSTSAPEITELLDRGVPVVACDREIADTRAGSVIADNEGGARRATEHLLNAGHTRIGLVGGPPAIQTGAERQAGYEAAMRARGLRTHISIGGFRIEKGREATVHLLAAQPDLTGLVIANNLMAIGALRALKQRGLRVPKDVAVVSIDDPIWADVTDPPLTTLAQPIKEMARAAVELLFQRINGEPNPPRRVVFDLELRVRASCGTKSSKGEV